MPKTITQYKLFLSSPSDLREERLIIEELIASTNRVLQSRSIQIKLVRWEIDAYPSAGSDVQKVVSGQLGEDYDIFFGMLWMKYGTPTQDAGSGTEEEFMNAMKRFEQSPRDIRIMFYFKTAPPTSLDDIVPSELEKVKAFRQLLISRNVFYNEFTDLTNSQQLLQIQFHLHKTIEELESLPLDNEKPALIKNDVEEDVQEVGFLDAIILAEEAMHRLTEDIHSIAHELTDFTEITNVVAEKLNRVARTGNQSQEVREPKRIMDEYATRMNAVNLRFQGYLSAYKTNADTAFGNFMTAITLAKSNGREDTGEYKQVLEVINTLKSQMSNAIITFTGLKDTILEGFDVTTQFIKAKRIFSTTIGLIVDEFRNSLSILNQVES